jgi:two-component system copper resistance phosphate regulon response regulator CusR
VKRSSRRGDDDPVTARARIAPARFASFARVRLLLLEDDQETADTLAQGLGREGHEVTVAHDVAGALAFVGAGGFDAAVLDLMVPGGSGYDVLDALRKTEPRTPVLLLTARSAVEERVIGLDRGADDYLVKPFSFPELAARVRALGRRGAEAPTRLRCDRLELDLLRRHAVANGVRLDLTRIEFGLLAALVAAGGDPVSRRDLLREVWNVSFDPGTNVVDVHVNRLRRKLEDAGLPGVVRTVRGQGYAAG